VAIFVLQVRIVAGNDGGLMVRELLAGLVGREWHCPILVETAESTIRLGSLLC